MDRRQELLTALAALGRAAVVVILNLALLMQVVAATLYAAFDEYDVATYHALWACLMMLALIERKMVTRG